MDIFSFKQSIRRIKKLGMLAHSFNPSTLAAEAGRFLSSRPAWSTK
jgi:major histocompatibility complex class I